MASISKKPPSLPLSLSTSAAPVLPVFSGSGADLSKQPKKKKSFGAFDKIRNAFSGTKPHRHSESEDIPKSGIALPAIITPTEEPSKHFANTKAFHSADNIFASNETEVKVSSPTLLLPSIVSKATSNENLARKKDKMMLRSTECLMLKESVKAPEHANLRVRKCDSTDDKFFREELSLPSKSNENIPGNEVQCSLVEVQLNDVRRNQANLEQTAAMHKRMMKPRGRRPPTLYQQNASQLSPAASYPDKSPLQHVAMAIEVKRTGVDTAAAVRNEPVKSETRSVESSVTAKLMVPLPMKRDKTFIPKLDEIQKARRRTIANFQTNDRQNVEVDGKTDEAAETSELNCVPAPAHRNASFKFPRKETEGLPGAESGEVDRSCPSPPKAPKVQFAEEGSVSREKSLENDPVSSRKSKSIQGKMQSMISKDGPKMGSSEPSRNFVPFRAEVVEKDPQINGRTQSSFPLQGATPPVDVKSFKTPDERGIRCGSEAAAKSDEIKSGVDKSSVDGALANKTDRPTALKKFDRKNLSNGQLEQTNEPGFKVPPKADAGKAQLAAETTCSSDNLASDKSSATKSEENSNPSDSFESVRQKFGSKSFKAPPRKSSEDPAVNDKAGQSKAPPVKLNPVGQRSSNEEKGSSSKLSSQGSMLQATAAPSFGNKKDVKPSSALQLKEIPPEPFKSPNSFETNKVNDPQSNATKVIPASKPRLNIKDTKFSMEMPSPPEDIQVSKPSSSKNSPSTHSKDFITNEPPPTASRPEVNSKPSVLRVSSSVNPKAAPNRLNFNPNNWMAERREQSEKPT